MNWSKRLRAKQETITSSPGGRLQKSPLRKITSLRMISSKSAGAETPATRPQKQFIFSTKKTSVSSTSFLYFNMKVLF